MLQASDSYLDLDSSPYVLYGVKYIDLVSLVRFSVGTRTAGKLGSSGMHAAPTKQT